MMVRPQRSAVLAMAVATAVVACGGDETSEPLGGSLTASGHVIDFQSGVTITAATSVTTSGLVPAPEVTTSGQTFSITGIPNNSAFQILAAAPPDHRATFSTTIVMTTSDVDDIAAPSVSEAFLGQLATTFGVTPTAAKGVLFVHLVDAATGAPRAGVASSEIVGPAGSIGPKFLTADLAPATTATATTGSGWAVFFEVAPGAVSIARSATATVTLEMAISPINAGTVTLAEAKVTNGTVALPTNVSFATQVFAIFSARGCVACHSGNGPGKELGGLKLDGSANAAYKELVLERPNTRVQTATPEASLVLRYPSREDPPDRHPNITFASALDPDYLKLLVWIREGARDN